jgi:DNA-binding transcriptional ArsR family regulator
VSEVDRRAAYLAQLTRLAGQPAVDSGAIKLPATSLLVMPSCLALCFSIVYRRLTMEEIRGPLERATAAEYASWFRALADATRVQIVSLLARRGEPMTVGAITAELEVGQSTVSEHLKILAGVRFVLADRHGTATYYRVNQACVGCFPSAADIVMGRPVPAVPSC